MVLATRVWAWKRRLHRVPRGRGRAVADASRAAMSRTCTAAMSCSYTGAAANSASASMSRSTGTAANSASGAAANSATCSASGAATSATTAAAATTAATTTATTAAVSEKRAGRCEQQCRYSDYCKKLGHPHHDAPLIRAQPGPTILPHSFKIGAHMVFHANCCWTSRRWRSRD